MSEMLTQRLQAEIENERSVLISQERLDLMVDALAALAAATDSADREAAARQEAERTLAFVEAFADPPDMQTGRTTREELRAERDRLRADLDATREAKQLIADILEEYAEEGSKEACDACEQCGPHVMCSFHSVLSLLAGRTQSKRAILQGAAPSDKETSRG